MTVSAYWLLPLCLAPVALCASASAQTSAEYAQMSKVTWSAFECASLAARVGETEQQERLFKLGYNRGKAFLDAVKAGKVEGSDIFFVVPWGISFRMDGPSSDFILGRIWEAAVESAGRAVYERDGKPVATDLWEMRAETEFRRRNCALL